MDFELIDQRLREGLSAAGYQNKTAALFRSLHSKLDADRQTELCELLLSLSNSEDKTVSRQPAGEMQAHCLEAFQGTMATLA